jgi:hypothetical protein
MKSNMYLLNVLTCFDSEKIAIRGAILTSSFNKTTQGFFFRPTHNTVNENKHGTLY